MSSKSLNERNTEDLVRQHFAGDPHVGLDVKEQKSGDPDIEKRLKHASKSKKGVGPGRPEFFIRSAIAPDFLIVVECKPDARHLRSTNLDQPKDYALDGALHYAKHLSSGYDVIAIGAAGQTKKDFKVATYRWFKGQAQPEELKDQRGLVQSLLAFDDYLGLRTFDPAVRNRTEGELMAWAGQLHNYLRDYAKVSEQEKPLIVSAILIALQDSTFSLTYAKLAATALPKALYDALEREIGKAAFPSEKQQKVLQPYLFITTHPEFPKVPPGSATKSPLQQLVSDLDTHVRPFLTRYHDVDVIGQFYGEFLRYTGGDKKGLGIVLTPRHVTELFTKIANISAQDTVLDICCGTGGFLITAMAEMDHSAGNNPLLHDRIRAEGLVGVEQQPTMFALAVSNMILRGDGKANLHQGSCFEEAIINSIINPPLDPGHNPPRVRHPRPNIGMINPPYSQAGDDLHELDFMNTMLDCLSPGGIGIAIVPMSVALGGDKSQKREALLEKHTLLAAMSMPNELFTPVATVTCILVFRAHRPHNSETPSWFGYWKDDGFKKSKKRGRVDDDHNWPAIRDHWIDSYSRKREIAGESVLACVTWEDEWCAEAYLKTDYSKLSQTDFEQVVRDYALFCLVGDVGGDKGDGEGGANGV